jgi:DNA-binding transcriptional LysR family regulator
MSKHEPARSSPAPHPPSEHPHAALLAPPLPRRTDSPGFLRLGSVDWEDIRTFVEVVATGSFFEAALVLDVNPATVSRRIARLEEAAGTTLFERTGAGATLLPEAQELAEVALRARRQAGEFVDVLHGFRIARGAVRIKATERVYNYMLTPLMTGVLMGPLQEVIARRPELLMPGIRLVSAEVGGQAEISLVWSAPGGVPDAEPDDKVRRLACLRYGVFYAGSYFDSGRPAPHVLEDLVESHSLVSLPRIHGTEAANAWGRWYDIVDRAKLPVAVVEWASVSERLVMSGSALALLPVYTPCLHPSLRELPLDEEPIHLDLWKVTRHGAERRADVCAVSEKLIQAFAEVDWETTPFTGA